MCVKEQNTRDAAVFIDQLLLSVDRCSVISIAHVADKDAA